MNDITIIYYTANKIKECLLKHTLDQLLISARDIPIISVSQKPMNLGQNICVGDIGRDFFNIYRQALIGAKEAKTEYIAMAEDDVLYSPDHFSSYRPDKGVFAYNLEYLSLYTWVRPPMYSSKGRRVLFNLICHRKDFIEAMEERFAKFPDTKNMSTAKWGEPGRYENLLGVKVWKTVEFYTTLDNIVFSHEEAYGYTTLGKRKKLGHHRSYDIPYWGKADKLLDYYYE